MESTNFLNLKAQGYIMHEYSEGTTKGLRIYDFIDSTVLAYNCFRLIYNTI